MLCCMAPMVGCCRSSGLEKLATTGGGGGGLLLELHCAWAAAGAMTCANVMVPSVSRIFGPKRVGRYAGTVMANEVRNMELDLLSTGNDHIDRDFAHRLLPKQRAGA